MDAFLLTSPCRGRKRDRDTSGFLPCQHIGHIVTLPQIATVAIPDAAFPASTRVGIWATENSETAADFNSTAEMFKLPMRAKQEVRINTGLVQPEKAISVTATLPAELAGPHTDH